MAISDKFERVLGNTIRLSAPAGRQMVALATQWFRHMADSVSRPTPTKLMSHDPSRLVDTLNRSSVGKMYMFFYNPKTKKKLPYYDTFPLIFPLRVNRGRILGINLHYLPPLLRAKLMDALYSTLNNKKFNDTTRLKISYDILRSAAKYRYFRPCLKSYLFSHVKSRFYHVKSEDWEKVIMLPVERFQKRPKTFVWKDSVARMGR